MGYIHKNRVIDNIKNASLKKMGNVSNYLCSISDINELNINDFDFDTYKELVRLELNFFSKIYNSLYKSNLSDDDYKQLLNKKELKKQVDEILKNESFLENFCVFRIQEFINKIINSLLDSEGNIKSSRIRETKNNKFIKYNARYINISNYLGFLNTEKIHSYLYDMFGLNKISDYDKSLIYDFTSVGKNSDKYCLNEANRIMFANGLIIKNGSIEYNHPYYDENILFTHIRNGSVANRKNKVKRKELIK